jgi:predicted amidohydrolase
MTEHTSYRALALQARCDSLIGLPDRAEARARIATSIDRIGRQVAASLAFIGADCRLVVLPEYFLTGHSLGESPAAWAARAALQMDGPEYEALGSIAQEHGIHLAGNAYELDPAFGDLFFQTSFIIGPTGEVILRYRRLNSFMTPTPHDVWDEYLDRYGIDGVFPVARTDLGTLACIASEEILFPEVARCFAMRGAEVFCHSTSEAGSPAVTAKDVAKRARAQENLAYVVSANSGGIDGSPIPGASTDGGSQIVHFTGRVLVEAGPGESMVATAEIDPAAQRRARRRPGMENLHARNRFGLYASSYADAADTFHRANTFSGGGPPERGAFVDAHRDVIERLSELGLI